MPTELVIVDRTHASRWLYSKSRSSYIRCVVSIGNEFDHNQRPPSGFNRVHCPRIRLNFDDIESASLPPEWGSVERTFYGPTKEDIQRLIDLYEHIDIEQDGFILCHCYAGVSRSSAAGYILYAMKWGPDRAKEAAQYVYAQQAKHKTRNQSPAGPNMRMVRLASDILGWDMVTPLEEWDEEFWEIRNRS